MTPSHAATDDPPDDHAASQPSTATDAVAPPSDVAPELHDGAAT
jgi:hypothetical protein